MELNLVQKAENLRQNPSITELIEIVVQLAKDFKRLECDEKQNTEEREEEVKRGVGRPKKNS